MPILQGAQCAVLERRLVALHGRRLEYFTIVWNALEGLVAVVAGVFAASISLVGLWNRQLHRGDIGIGPAMADVR
jgi:hypothetical protein